MMNGCALLDFFWNLYCTKHYRNIWGLTPLIFWSIIWCTFTPPYCVPWVVFYLFRSGRVTVSQNQRRCSQQFSEEALVTSSCKRWCVIWSVISVHGASHWGCQKYWEFKNVSIPAFPLFPSNAGRKCWYRHILKLSVSASVLLLPT